jgi:KTSC domain
MPRPQKIDSSAIESVEYDESLQKLLVKFRDSGETYAYFMVPRATFENLMAAPSKGAYVNRRIKPKYPGEKLDARRRKSS